MGTGFRLKMESPYLPPTIHFGHQQSSAWHPIQLQDRELLVRSHKPILYLIYMSYIGEIFRFQDTSAHLIVNIDIQMSNIDP